MASEQYDPRYVRRDVPGDVGGEPSLGELLRRLTTDTGELVRQELTLAKAEMRDTGATLARDGAKLGVAVVFALAGVLALTAFLSIVLGNALNSYWLSTLIVGVVMLGVGAVLVRSAVADIKRRGLAPRQTVETLREDAAWVKREVADVKREMTR